MKLTVLVDNNTFIDEYLLGEPALSFYLEDGDQKILFDTGYSDASMRNAKTLGIDLSHINRIVISHGHNDHTLGLCYLKQNYDLKKATVIAHPDAFKEKFFEGESIGAPFREDQLESFCKVSFSSVPVKVSENLTFLGEIPELITSRRAIGQKLSNGKLEDDYVLDDTALVYQKPEGLFIITGCSHSGICNIIEYAKQVCKEDRILGVIGGFHLFKVNSELEKTIQYFQDNRIENLYPCHCVSFPAKAEIHKHIPIHDVYSGLIIEI